MGFALADHGYDSSMSTFKAYMIAVTPASQHDDVFVMGTLTGAVGGCLTSLLGFVDLASLFPPGQPPGRRVLDSGVAQCLAQAVILLVKLLALGTCTLLTGSERPSRRRLEEEAPPSSPSSSSSSSCPAVTGGVDDDQERRSHGDAAASLQNGKHDSHTESAGDIIDRQVQDEKSHLLRESNASLSSSSTTTRPGIKRGGARKRVALCVMTFLGLCTNYAYFVYVTNYVGEVIYEGDPLADAGSDAYEKYVEGVHVASLGMLTFYGLFVAFNLLHNKVLKRIGSRAEYLGSSLVCCALMLTLAFTESIVVFFANAVTLAVFRSAVYTIPFMLSNSYAQQESGRGWSQGEGEGEGSGSSAPGSGLAMASITAMIPGSYFLVSLVMGPLMDVTGYPGTPIFFAAGSCVLGILSTFFVDFE